MDLVHSCKDKLAYFRIKELKDVLTQLGLPKQGKKQELADKILSLLSDEQGSKTQAWAKRNSIGITGVAKIIDDTYRKMQTPGATDLVSKSQTSSDANRVKPNEEANDSYQFDRKEPDMKVRCPCGSSLRTDSMIKCEDPRCQVWQHIECVIIPEKALEGVLPELPTCFYCELCRLKRADPFWVTIAHPMLPSKLISNFNSDGSSTTQSMEKTYHLSRADKELLQRNEYDLQIWCMLFNDKVPFRMQWPQHSDLQVNGITMRTTNRPGAQLLGINGRDDGPLITTYSKEGINKASLSHCDGRTFCIGIRIAKRRTVQQVLNMIPKEADGERFEEALARVCRCVGGGTATDNADSDSDLEVVADSITVNLRCPMSGSRMKTAGRFKPCIHMGCFDLDTFVELNQRSRKWQCPICLKNYSLENIIVDPYFNRITSMMKNCGEDVTEIEVKPDGSWRAKNENENKDLARWHLYDGSLCTKIEVQEKQGLNSFKIKQEDMSGSHTSTLKLGMRKNENGVWELSKPKSAEPPINHVQENQFQNLMPTSSSDDQSVNQDGSGNVATPQNNNNVHDLGTLNFDLTYEIEDRIPPQVPAVDANVIVLSDSDEDNTIMAPPPNPNDMSFPPLGYSNNENGDYVIPQWQMPTYTQAGFQLFDTDANVSDALAGVPPINDYNFETNGGLGETSATETLPTFPNDEVNESLVDNPLAYGNDDPSLQILFPIPSHSGEIQQSHLNDHNDMASDVGLVDNWISLSLGGGEQTDNDSLNVVNSKRQSSGQESDTVSASLGLSMNRDKGKKETSSNRISDGPFSHPRQPRSVRPRLYLSINSDSD